MWANIENWRLIVYPFIDGDTRWTEMTAEQWQKVGSIFQCIHPVKLPPSGFEGLRKETFDPSEYTRWAHAFETQHLQASGEESASKRALRSSWIAHQPAIETVVAAPKSWRENSSRERCPMSPVTRTCILLIRCVIILVMCMSSTGMR